MIYKKEKWQKINIKKNNPDVIAFLQNREAYYVNAISRFLRDCDDLWVLMDNEKNIEAILLHSKWMLFPVFNGKKDIPLPNFLGSFLKKNSLHAVQGLASEVETMEKVLLSLNALPTEFIDYDLMLLDKSPNLNCLKKGPRNLILRRPNILDMDVLFKLRTEYEKEEVIRKTDIFNPAATRLVLERIMVNELFLIAELDGCILGKINTNATSFSYHQIGGVYVLPEYRNLGVASRLTAFFADDIIASGRCVSLFVKKQNLAARSMYKNVGFSIIDDYRITYYS